MSVVRRVARNLRHVYGQQGAAGLLAVSRYYLARTRAVVIGPGRECPICGWKGRDFAPLFLLTDRYVRPSAVCPGCGSRERQRAFVPGLRAFLAAELGTRRVEVLEISPDPQVASVLRGFASRYRASNYENPAPGELQLDLLDLALPAESVDLVVMTYVLCCVPDDLRAAANLWRILRPGGMIVACEAFSTNGAHDEWGARGHGGTWRQYGSRDAHERFPTFDVALLDLTRDLSPAERTRRGVRVPEHMLVLRKAGAEDRT